LLHRRVNGTPLFFSKKIKLHVPLLEYGVIGVRVRVRGRGRVRGRVWVLVRFRVLVRVRVRIN